jgi:preprotein translocase subunit YajC
MKPEIMLLFYGAIFAVFYFFFIRPQSQKAKEAKKFLEEIKKGDKVVTTNGIHGIIDKIDDTTFLVEVDKGVKIRIEKSGISADITKAINSSEDTKS